MKGELTWENLNDIDYRSPLVLLIGQHHRKFLKGEGHGRVVLFTKEEDAQQPPLENISLNHLLERFPRAIGALCIARTRDPGVNNVVGWFQD